jgi:hypothetical protein
VAAACELDEDEVRRGGLMNGSPSNDCRSFAMKSRSRIVLHLFAVVVVAGCASTKVSDRQRLVDEKLPRPDHILVHDFVATPADLPADSPLAGASSDRPPQTAEQIATGRGLGDQIAAELVKNIRGMGLPAERVSTRTGSTRTTPQINNIVI